MTGERRRAHRYRPQGTEPSAQVRIRAGRELTVLDVSSGGVLVEGTTRLLPGTHVDLHVMTAAGRVLVRSRVLRVAVSALLIDAVWYRGALMFEQPIQPMRGYAVPVATESE